MSKLYASAYAVKISQGSAFNEGKHFLLCHLLPIMVEQMQNFLLIYSNTELHIAVNWLKFSSIFSSSSK